MRGDSPDTGACAAPRDSVDSCESQLNALAAEIETAIDAISSCRLICLEESIERQEALCAALFLNKVEAADVLRQRATGQTIRALSLRYKALLRHSGKSLAFLSALCRNHASQSQEVDDFRSKHQTWSCEM